MFDAVVVEPAQPADSAVIWLHGLGASGHDFESALPLWVLRIKPRALSFRMRQIFR